MTARKVPDQAPTSLPPLLVTLARQLSRMPGIGERTGLRLAIFLGLADLDFAEGIGAALGEVRKSLGRCDCGMLAERLEERWVCAICRDRRRDPSLLCIVARVPDLLGIERSTAMRGRYFVLGRLLSPLDGVEAEDLPMDELRARLAGGEVKEILIATPPSVDGDATALFLGRELRGLGCRMTRLASGVPHGGALEETDALTLHQAIAGRTTIE